MELLLPKQLPLSSRRCSCQETKQRKIADFFFSPFHCVNVLLFIEEDNLCEYQFLLHLFQEFGTQNACLTQK